MFDSKNPVAKKEKIVIQELPDELLVYDLSTDKAFCLNKTSAFVWKSCDGTKDVTAITQLMEKEFKSPIDEDLVWLALDQLGKDRLLDVKPENKFSGYSRREVIRRVGLASVIALPIIASLAAPVAAQVATCSGASDGTPCQNNNRICCGGVCCPAGVHECDTSSGQGACPTSRQRKGGPTQERDPSKN